MPRMRSLVHAALWLSLAALAFAFGFQKIRTFDYWWHLKTGQLIAETGAVPRVDPYSYTVPGVPWLDIHWLFQLALNGVHSLGGHAAVVLAKVATVWALVAVLASIGWRRERPLVTILALALMLAIAGDRFMPRPELPSFLLLAGVLALLDRFERRGDAWVYAVVPLQIVWANLHGLFALGLVVCAIHLASEIARPLVAPGERWRAPRIRRLASVTLLACAATLLNPNFVDGALYPIQQLGMIGPPEDRGLFGSLIAELIPPLGGLRPAQPFVLGLVGTMAALSLGAMLLNWRTLRAADPLLWVAFLYLALGAQRNLALFAIVAGPILARNLNEYFDRHPVPARALDAAGAVAALALALLATDVASGRFFDRVGSLRESGLGVVELLYPSGALEWVARESPSGPICHHMASGGYLIWRLYPEYKTMVDGRLEVFGAEKFAELQVVGPQRFRALHEQYEFGVVLVQYSLVQSEGLLWWLYLNSNWRLVYVDEVAAVFVRDEEARSRGWAELDVDAPDLFASLDGRLGPSDRQRRFARVSFYSSLRRYPVALEGWEKTLERYPDLPQGPILHAMLLQRNGHLAAAEAVLRRLLGERPDDKRLLTQVGDLRLEGGDVEAATDLYDRALALDPRFPYAALRRALLAERQGHPELAIPLYTTVIAATGPADAASILALSRLRVMRGEAPDFDAARF